MNFAVLSDEKTFNELTNRFDQHQWIHINNWKELNEIEHLHAFFNLSPDACLGDYSTISCPVFINSVSFPLKNFTHSGNVIRMNGWNGFVKRNLWELAGTITQGHVEILNELNIKHMLQPDEPGFVSARVIAMIINEGFFAKEQGVSTEEEIDIAMKLGTGYPKGPFEWLQEIGAFPVLELLKVLAKQNVIYTPCPLLEKQG